MKIGLVGLGRMGGGMRRRLRAAGHEVVGYDLDTALADVPSLAAMVAELAGPRVVWCMLPAGAVTESALTDLGELLSPGDVVIDGGNSYFKDSLRRADALAAKGLRFLDIGTAGGVQGADFGYCLMVGGPRDAFEYAEPFLAALAPEDGYAYFGVSGAGHFAKMVHNGVEYGLMQAYAEGFALLQSADEYRYDLGQVARVWQNGGLVRSWLLEVTGAALQKDPQLASLRGYVDDSGEGRWTVQEAVARGIDVSVLSQALFARFTSREEDSFAMRLLAAMRREFGGHAVREG